jgi:hypothetical protein
MPESSHHRGELSGDRRGDVLKLSGERSPHDEIERRPRIRVVMPGNVVQEQPFGAGGDCGASSPWIMRAEFFAQTERLRPDFGHVGV